MGIGLVLFGLLTRQATAAQMNAPVTFSNVAQPAADAITGLSKAAGVPLRASATIKPSILLIAVDHQPLKDVMARLAEATGGSWTFDSGAYYLTRSEADERKLEAARKAEIVAKDKAALKALQANTPASKPLSSQEANELIHRLDGMIVHNGNSYSFHITNPEDSLLMSQGPALKRLGDMIFPKVTPEMLAAAPDGARTVFSSNPTNLELPLPFDSNAIMEAFAADTDTWRGAVEQLPPIEQSFFLRRRGLMLSGQPLPENEPKPAKLNLVIDRTSESAGDLPITLEVAAADGTILSEANPTRRTVTGQVNTVKTEGAKEEPLNLTKANAAFLYAYQTTGNDSATAPIAPEVIAKSRQPDKFEPLGTYPSELIVKACKTQKLSLAADLSDFYLHTPWTEKITATQVAEWLETQGPSPATVNGAWLVLKHGGHLPYDRYIERPDRNMMAKLFASAPDAPSIESLGDFTLALQPQERTFAFSNLSGDAALGSLYRTLYGEYLAMGKTQWQSYQLLGLLLRRGQGSLPDQAISFASLDSTCLDLLGLMVYQSELSVMRETRFGDSIFRSGAKVEPCDILPNGLPRDGSVTIKTTTTNEVFSTGHFPRPVQAYEIASNSVRGETFPNMPTTHDKYRIGHHRVVGLIFNLGPGITVVRQVEENHYDGAPVAYGDLPETFRKEVATQLARLQEQEKRRQTISNAGQ